VKSVSDCKVVLLLWCALLNPNPEIEIQHYLQSLDSRASCKIITEPTGATALTKGRKYSWGANFTQTPSTQASQGLQEFYFGIWVKEWVAKYKVLYF